MKILVTSLVIFAFTAVRSHAQLEFFTAKEGLNVATASAQILSNPKLVNIFAASMTFTVGGLGTFDTEYQYSGNDIGKSNLWLYTFSPEGDPTSSVQFAVVSFMQTFIPLAVDIDFADYGVEMAYDKYIDTATMLDSDEFTLGLVANPLFDTCQVLIQHSTTFNAIGIGAVKGLDFIGIEDDSIYWMRFLRTPNLEIGCRSDFDNIANLDCMMLTSIAEDYSASNISIFPNPATNIVNILNPDAEPITSVSIYDISGKILLIVNSTNTESIDITSLATGNYYICFEIGNRKIFRSLIIQ